jgi:hypothetical protein
MSVCPETGLSIPECSCRRCLEEQVARMMPQLLGQVPKSPPSEPLPDQPRPVPGFGGYGPLRPNTA